MNFKISVFQQKIAGKLSTKKTIQRTENINSMNGFILKNIVYPKDKSD